jgi:outer membrane biosynthesis protein TonB
MGHDITYCSVCHEQIRWQDLQQGQAFKFENRSFCLKCGPDALKSLPQERVKEILQNITTPARAMPIAPATPSRGTAISHPTPRPQPAISSDSPGSRSPWGLAGLIAGVAAVLIALIVALSGGKEPEPEAVRPPEPRRPEVRKPLAAAATPAPPPKETSSPKPPSDPPAAPSREAAAKDALQKAREWALANPSDMDGAVRRLQDACFLATGTAAFDDAKKELELYRKRQREFFATELAPLDEEARAACAQERFMKALDLLGTAAQLHPSPEWQMMVSKKVREINDEAFRLLDTLKQKALQARQNGDEDQVTALRARVAGWGVPLMIKEFRSALGE